MKPQEGIGCPSAPLRRGPDGLEFRLQGTMLNVAQVSTKCLSFINLSVRKINPWQWRVSDWPPNRKWFGSNLVFHSSTGRSPPVSLMGIVIVKFTHAIARVLKLIKVWAEGGATFSAGINVPFIASLPAARSRAPTALCQGGCDCGVMATPSISQGVCNLHHGCSHLVGTSSYLFSHGRLIKNMERKRSWSGETPGGRCCLSFPMRKPG
jgi:hypothetical protein